MADLDYEGVAAEDANHMEVVVLGRHIGTASGWDEVGDQMVCFYTFIPTNGVQLLEGTLTVCFETGQAETSADDGVVLSTVDIVPILNRLPVVKAT